jgi:NADPH-dependent curcumin reductase CurA
MENRRIVLASRPKGSPTPENFRLERAPAPEARDGEVLLKTRWLSLDPYMRGRMNEGRSYAQPVEVGETMVGGTVAEVVQSKAAGLAPGDLVSAYSGWQDYAVAPGPAVTKLPAGLEPPSYALGVLGMPGFTAYHGLLNIGEPKAGETVVVAAATGGVGAVVGQVAKIKGCRAVGVAGGPEKCALATGALGFDACIDHKAPDFAEQLKAACPKGIDVYFENVAGKVLEGVLPLLNDFARVPVCGLISAYNAAGFGGEGPSMNQLMGVILVRRLKVQGFIISDAFAGIGTFQRDMAGWVASGQVKYLEHRIKGLENAPAALIGLLKGENKGKVVVEVA